MTMISSVSDLISGVYGFRIQDALGDGGATATFKTEPSGNSLQISGTPTGSFLKVEAKQAASAAVTKDIISLSPAAQAKLTQQSIAIQLLTKKQDSASSGATSSSSDTARTTGASASSAAVSVDASSAVANSGASDVSATDVTALSKEDPTQVIKDAASAATSALASISTTSGFAQAVAADPSFLSSLSFSNEDAATIKTAISNNTLVVQSANDAGYNGAGGIEFSGRSGSLLASDAYAAAPSQRSNPAGTQQFTIGFGFGALVLTLPK